MANVAPEDSELTIEDLWEEAEENFKKLTGENLRGRSSKGIEYVMSRLDAKYGSGKKEGQSKTKRVVFNVINAIQLIGGIAAQAASQAFAPSQLCFSAISFLLDIPAKVDKLFGDVGSLFEELNSYLVKLEIYKRIEKTTKVPKELIKFTNDVLVSFIDICALAHGLAFGSKAAKLKASFLVSFTNDDSGVSAALRNFAALINKQTALESSLNLEHTLSVEKHTQQIPTIASGVTDIRETVNEGFTTLLSAENTRSENKRHDEQCEQIMQKLHINNEAMKEQEKVFKGMQGDAMRNSDTGLQQNEHYRSWADVSSDTQSVLLLSGEHRSGKSYLVNAIIEDMESKASASSDMGRQMNVAYYFFQEKDDRALRLSKKETTQFEHSVDTALKHVAYQLAKRNKGYAKELMNLLKSFDVKGRRAGDLWNDLNLGRPKSEAVHVLIFDGLDQIPESSAESFFRLIEKLDQPRTTPTSGFLARSKVRILVSSTPKSFPDFLLSHVPVLDVVELNASNVVSFIDQELHENKIWQEDNANTKALTAFIRETLPKSSKGDFSIISQALESVQSAIEDGKGLQKAKLALIDACEQDQSTIAPKIIDELNKTLNSQDIKRLNILLMWVVFGLSTFNLSELRAANFLHSRDDPCQSFETIMMTKYAKIFSVNLDGDVVLREEVKNFFRDNPRPRGNAVVGVDAAGPRITLELKITNAPLAQVRKFLWNLNERVNFEPFLFESVEANTEDNTIQVFEVDAMYTMTVKCLELLNDDYDPITEDLIGYALLRTNDALRLLLDEANSGMLAPDEIKTIQCGIIAYLSDTDMLEKHLLKPVYMRDFMLKEEEDGGPHIIRRWLELEEGTSLLERRDKRRLTILMNKAHGPLSFYRPITVLMAERWLLSNDYPAREAFDWIDGYLELARIVEAREKVARSTPQLNRVRSADKQPSPLKLRCLTRVQRVQKAARWVQDNLDPEQDSLWHKRLADTYRDFGKYEIAIQEYTKAKSKDPMKWPIFAGCALSYAELKRFDDATAEMTHALDLYKKIPGRDYKKEEEYIASLRLIVLWAIKGKKFNEAVQQTEKVLELDPDSRQTQMMMLDAMRRSKAVEPLKMFLTGTMADTSTEQEGVTKIVAMITSGVNEFLSTGAVKVFDMLVLAARASDTLQYLLETLRSIIELESTKSSLLFHSATRLLEALVLMSIGTSDDEERALSIAEDISCTKDLAEGYENGERSAAILFRDLNDLRTNIYFQHAVSAINADRDFSSDLERLEDIFKKSSPNSRTFPGPDGLGYLVKCRLLLGQKEKARELLLPSMEEALEMLANDTPEDDAEAIIFLGRVLAYAQDDYNALTAWSLLAPFDAEVGLSSEHFVTKAELEEMQENNPDTWEEIEPFDDDASDMSSVHGSDTDDDGYDDDSSSASDNSTPYSKSKDVDLEPNTNGETTKLSNGSGSEEETDSEVPGTIMNNSEEGAASQSLPKEEISDAVPAFGNLKIDTEQIPNATDDLQGQQSSPNVESAIANADQHADKKSTVPGVEINTPIQHIDSDLSEGPKHWIRVKREHISPSTLEAEETPLQWFFDPRNEDYIVIKEYLDADRRNRLFKHTYKLKAANLALPKRYECDYTCGKVWAYASDVYMCRYCSFTVLCGECLEEIRSGKARHINICDPNHEWLHVPTWSNQHFKEVGKEKVRINGEIGPDGRITGGTVVPFPQWLATIRKDWGVTSSDVSFTWMKVTT